MREQIAGTEIQGITFYTVQEVALMLSITPQTVRSYIKEGKLQGKRIGRPILSTQESLNAFLEPSFSGRGIGGDS
jgi:excisionase family DNA binding protein